MKANNYVAQAIDGILGLKPSHRKLYNDADIVKIKELTNSVKSAIHFTLPDGGRILNDDLKGLYGLSLNMPFKEITLSFQTLHGGKIIIYCQDIGDFIIIHPIINMSEIGHGWIASPIYLLLQKDLNLTHNDFEKYDSAMFDILKSSSNCVMCLASFCEKQDGYRESMSFFRDGCYAAARHLFELLEALSCKNIEQTIIQHENKEQNDKRARKNKLPIYEERILTIKATPKEGMDIGAGAHASPRQHLRRGHIRRLDTGNVWVNACVVGSSEKGVIKKSYNVTA